MTISHSTRGASGAYRWMQCPGSIRLSQGLPSQDSIYAKEGNAAHDLAEVCLRKSLDAVECLGETMVVGNHAFEVDEEMTEAVQVYLDYVRSVMQKEDIVYIEQQFSLKDIHEDCFGTVDCAIYRPSTAELFVIDYKHGKGVAVDVKGNSQLRYYALGAALAVPDRALSDVHITVVQPRAPHADGPIRSEKIDSLELMDWSEDLLQAVKATYRPNAPLKAGDWCKFCTAAPICPALKEHAIESAQADFGGAPEDLDPYQLAEILEKANLIEDWVRAVRAYAFESLERGNEVPGYKLVAKRPQRKWIDEAGVARHLIGTGLEEDELYTKKFKSPAQIEKLLPKDRRSELEDYFVKESSGNTLAPASDKREAVNISLGDEFGAEDDIF